MTLFLTTQTQLHTFNVNMHTLHTLPHHHYCVTVTVGLLRYQL